MATDILAPAVVHSIARDLEVPDLIRTAETLKQSGQTGAVAGLYAAWLEQHPGHPLQYAVLFNHSVTLADAGELALARQALEQAIAFNPDFMPAYINLGRVLERQGSVGPAVVQWSAALARMAAVNGPAITHKTTALNQSARALEAANQDAPAEAMLRQSLELDCGQREAVQHLVALRQRQCEWPVALPSERVSRETLLRGMSPLSAAAFSDDPLWQLALADHYNRAEVGTPAGALEAWPAATGRGGPLRVGYLSSDLREHAVGYLMSEVFALHDRGAVEVHAYYCGPESKDALHAHFQASADRWTHLGALDDDAAAARIAADGIQVLVDLNGYTREARLGVVARRPAPGIVNWLGFPGTMASPYHHYLVADEWIVPPDHERWYSERVLRLPCYQPNNRARAVAPARPSRAQAGLPAEGTVFCCFNGVHKVTRFTFDRWLRVLAEVPGSVLWLLSSTEPTHQRLRTHAASRGIAPERLVFADKLANPAHLARYPLADLFLDTTPYGAHTTASDALWMGVPVLTVSGRSFASRVCGSLARAAGTPELVCATPDEYVALAVALGRDPARLGALRARLEAGRATCVLFDTPGLVRSLEALYQGMWQDCLSGRLPRPDLANLDAYLEVGNQAEHEEREVQSIPDYLGWWRERLARRARFRPLPPDRRLVDAS